VRDFKIEVTKGEMIASHVKLAITKDGLAWHVLEYTHEECRQIIEAINQYLDEQPSQ